VTTTVAAARTAALLHDGHPPAAALTAGFHDAFGITGALALAAALMAATLVGRTRRAGPAADQPASTARGEAARTPEPR